MFVVYAAMFTIRPREIRTAALLRNAFEGLPAGWSCPVCGAARRNSPRNKNDDIVKSPYAALRFIPPAFAGAGLLRRTQEIRLISWDLRALPVGTFSNVVKSCYIYDF